MLMGASAALLMIQCLDQWATVSAGTIKLDSCV